MVFSSLIFTFYFLPAVVLLYYFAKDKYRNYLLLFSSLCFYAYGEPRFVFAMLASITVNYLFAIWIAKQRRESTYAKRILWAAVLIDVGILFVFKYLSFTAGILEKLLGTSVQLSELWLPIGISFFTFQALSYVIDVYRGTVEVQKNPFYVALYISFFPQLIAGPIVRYSTIEAQITGRVSSLELFSDGVQRFFLGFAKKVIIANNVAAVAENAFSCEVSSANPLLLWIGALCFSLQIFFDFSGYSDMAIGLGKMFGFEFEENFNYPYAASSVTDFWRRWHISLGQWFRDYVYFPLGGSRVTKGKHIRNLLLVWILTGLWHGAGLAFIAWGLLYFFLLVMEKYFVHPENFPVHSIRKMVWRVITLLSVNFGWVIFNSNGLKAGLQYCFAMLGGYHKRILLDADVLVLLREYGWLIIIGIFASTPIPHIILERVEKYKAGVLIYVMKPVYYTSIFLIAVSYLILGAHNPFIYFNF